MSLIDASWEEISSRPEFSALARRRRLITIRLLAISMALFFSIPLISQFWPGFFRLRLGGAVNVGLVYLVGQYVVGIAIACCYAVQLRSLDEMVNRLGLTHP